MSACAPAPRHISARALNAADVGKKRDFMSVSPEESVSGPFQRVSSHRTLKTLNLGKALEDSSAKPALVVKMNQCRSSVQCLCVLDGVGHDSWWLLSGEGGSGPGPPTSHLTSCGGDSP